MPTTTSRSLEKALHRSAEIARAVEADPARFRSIAGDRPTGPLHLGHLFGTLTTSLELQELGVEVLILVADYQALSDRDAPSDFATKIEDQVADYLAVGIDPARSTVFAHSRVPALNELLVTFLSLVTFAEVRRNPTVKDELQASGGRQMSGLLFAYPVHQAADILACGAGIAPVGRDQLPHLELTRTIARRFNERYASRRPLFNEPDALLSSAPLLLGLDGQKMSKSRGNAIALRASADETARLVRGARSDAERTITYEPNRRPEVANLLMLAALTSGRDPFDVANEIAGRGSAALKALVTESINDYLGPIRRRRAELADDRAYLRSVLRLGSERVAAVAEHTLEQVKTLVGLAPIESVPPSEHDGAQR